MNPIEKTMGLGFWSRPVKPVPLGGGRTNSNFIVEDKGERFVVRIGEDIPIHGVMRFNELAAAKAAYKVGIGPEIVYHIRGALVMRFIEGHTFTEEEVGKDENLERVLNLIKICHYAIPKKIEGPVLSFSPFHISRSYISLARKAKSKFNNSVSGLLKINDELEEKVGNIILVFGHNDLISDNFLDDGKKLWLLDWEYAGYSAAIFDLANLSSNNQFLTKQDDWMLENYYEKKVTDLMRYRLEAMKCASLLRETMWSIVQEFHSNLEVNYEEYTNKNLERLNIAYYNLN
jgi:thiamine kinase-like enzyme